MEKLNKKSKNNNVKPFMVKNHLWVFINAQIENPAFDSQVGVPCTDKLALCLQCLPVVTAAAGEGTNNLQEH